MSLHKKDFKAIAETISKIEDPEVREKETEKWIEKSQKENQLFKEELFREACKPEDKAEDTTYVTINIVSLADEIAQKLMDRQHPEGWEEWNKEDDCYQFKSEKLQDKYNDLYDKAHNLISTTAKKKETP